jgi:hypothetical protein
MSNPVDFLQLAVEKQILFLGDDSTGVYASMRRGDNFADDETYVFWKGLSNTYWIAVWAVLLVYALVLGKRRKLLPAPAAAVYLGFLYFYAIHTLFESNAKYHLPTLPMLALLFGIAITSLAQDGGAGEHKERLSE